MGSTKKMAFEKFEGRGASYEALWGRGHSRQTHQPVQRLEAKHDLHIQGMPGGPMGLEQSEQRVRKGKGSGKCGQRGQIL